jgi:hypothetical protein
MAIGPRLPTSEDRLQAAKEGQLGRVNEHAGPIPA